jgi:hypothetical protein
MTRSKLTAMTLLLLLGVSFGLMVSPGATEPLRNAVEEPAKFNLERLLEDLGSDLFETREAATRALEALEDEPIGLREGLKSPDLEVRRRVEGILKSYVPKRARRGLTKAVALAKEGRIEEMVERLVLWNEFDREKEKSKAIAELTARAFEWEHRHFFNLEAIYRGFKLGGPRFKSRSQRKKYSESELKEFRESPSVEDIAEVHTNYKEVRGKNIVEENIQRTAVKTIYIASGDVRLPGVICGVIFANGNVEVLQAQNSIIFCAGDFTCDCTKKGGALDHCFIVANGEVRCSTLVRDCTIVAGRSVLIPKGAKIYSGAILTVHPDRFPLKFFVPETVGLTVGQHHRGNTIIDLNGIAITGDGVSVYKVRKDSPFAAGLRAEDVITAVDKIEIRSSARLRKVLCGKLAEGGPTITFTVLRAGKTVEVPIAVKD